MKKMMFATVAMVLAGCAATESEAFLELQEQLLTSDSWFTLDVRQATLAIGGSEKLVDAELARGTHGAMVSAVENTGVLAIACTEESPKDVWVYLSAPNIGKGVIAEEVSVMAEYSKNIRRKKFTFTALRHGLVNVGSQGVGLGRIVSASETPVAMTYNSETYTFPVDEAEVIKAVIDACEAGDEKK